MSLQRYTEKRDFTKTPEPNNAALSRSQMHRFVIQKHEASHLHYDFRLEIDGTLKSWAVPKGIPFSKGEKRLAMHVEDHPISYRAFEGIIPKGQYGGGTVMVWDFGTFQSSSRTPAKDLAGGKLHFTLHGKKLSGEWYLVRLKTDRDQWLLIRGGEDMKPISPRQDDTSALSGKSMSRIAKSERVWNSHPKTENPRRHGSTARSSILPFFEPMMAKLVKAAPGGNWQYEIKYDGYRALAFIENGENGKIRKAGKVQLLSRNGKDLAGTFPEVVESLHALQTRNTVLDGEIIAVDDKGKSSFQLLQAFQLNTEKPPLFYYIFDLPQLEGEDLRQLPLSERQSRLKDLLGRPPGILRLTEVLGSKGDAILEQARKHGLEGLIGKRKESLYEAGKRTGAWVKLKALQEQEFVIGGYSEPAGARQHFGALLVGVFQNRKLVFSGKVGTGFSESILKSMFSNFQTLATSQCPFTDLPESSRSRYGSGITASEMKRCHWIKPKLICEVRFTEWTRDGKLRHPVFLGMRDDKKASEVIREEPS